MSGWVIKFRRPLRRERTFSEMLRGATRKKKSRAFSNKTDKSAEPLIHKGKPWQPRDPTSFSLGEMTRYWTGRYWSEDYNRAMKYPSQDEGEAEIFRICALDVSLLGELEVGLWCPLSKPAKVQTPEAKPAKAAPPPVTMIVSKPKRQGGS